MKSTDKKLFACEEREARLARQEAFKKEHEQEVVNKEVDEARFWKFIYILTHVLAVLLVLGTLYRLWGK